MSTGTQTFTPEQNRKHLLLLMHLFNPNNGPVEERPLGWLAPPPTGPLPSPQEKLNSLIGKLQNSKQEFNRILQAVSPSANQVCPSINLPSNADSLIGELQSLISTGTGVDICMCWERLDDCEKLFFKLSCLYVGQLSRENVLQDSEVGKPHNIEDHRDNIAYFFYNNLQSLQWIATGQQQKEKEIREAFSKFFECFVDMVDGKIEITNEDMKCISDWQPPIGLEQRCKIIEQYVKQQLIKEHKLYDGQIDDEKNRILMEAIAYHTESYGYSTYIAAIDLLYQYTNNKDCFIGISVKIDYIAIDQHHKKCAQILQDLAAARHIPASYKIDLLSTVLLRIHEKPYGGSSIKDDEAIMLYNAVQAVVESLPQQLDERAYHNIRYIGDNYLPKLQNRIETGIKEQYKNKDETARQKADANIEALKKQLDGVIENINKITEEIPRSTTASSSSTSSSPSLGSTNRSNGSVESTPATTPDTDLAAVKEQIRQKIEDIEDILQKYIDFEMNADILIDEINGREEKGALPAINGLTTEERKTEITVEGIEQTLTIQEFVDRLRDGLIHLSNVRAYTATLSPLLQEEERDRYRLQNILQDKQVDFYLSQIQDTSQTYTTYAAAVKDKIKEILAQRKSLERAGQTTVAPAPQHPQSPPSQSRTAVDHTQPVSTREQSIVELDTSGTDGGASAISPTYRTAVQHLVDSFQKSLLTTPMQGRNGEQKIVLTRKGNEDFVQLPIKDGISKVEVAPLKNTSVSPTTKAVKDNTLVAVVPSVNDSAKHILQFTNVEAELRQTKQLLIADGDAVAMGYTVQQAVKTAEAAPTPAKNCVEKAVGTKIEEIAKQTNEGKIDKTELAKVLGKCVKVASDKLQQLMSLVVRMHQINLLTGRSVKETGEGRAATNREIAENLKLYNEYLAQMAETFKITDAKATGATKVYNGKILRKEIEYLEEQTQQEKAKQQKDEERLKQLETQLKEKKADFAKLTELLNVSVVNVIANPAVAVQLRAITLANIQTETAPPEGPLHSGGLGEESAGTPPPPAIEPIISPHSQALRQERQAKVVRVSFR